MEPADYIVFSKLYKEAYQRCFSKPLSTPITEAESKLFYQQVLDTTGLTVGWRSLKNFSLFVLDGNRNENPSVASMDTLARFVLKAPYTNDIDRKDNEGHHPYWFMYRSEALGQPAKAQQNSRNRIFAAMVVIVLCVVAGIFFYNRNSAISINENFKDVSESYLNINGWTVLNKDAAHWAKRRQSAGGLTLFTLQGDNWPEGNAKPEIKNILVHALPTKCFTTELQLQRFIPSAEWQQAGLLLLADTTLTSPSIRVSLAFNDMFGGYNKPREILVQAISSAGYDSKPEEFAHWPVLTVDTVGRNPSVIANLNYAAIRIERMGKQYRVLYAGGATPNGAFKEVALKNISFEPRYVAIFAIKGRVRSTPVVPVTIQNFKLQSTVCE